MLMHSSLHYRERLCHRTERIGRLGSATRAQQPGKRSKSRRPAEPSTQRPGGAAWWGGMHDPVHLPYYMEAVEQGNASMWTKKHQYLLEDREESQEEN